MNLRINLAQYLLVLSLILVLNFIIPRAMPGDPFLFLSSDEGDVVSVHSQEQIEKYKEYYGLDKPITNQFLDYIKNLFRGNLGYSIYFKKPVTEILISRAPWTIGISLISLFISVVIGLVLGSVSAYLRDTIFDKTIYPAFVFLSEIPSFLIAILFLFLVAAKSETLPLSGGITVFKEFATGGEKAADIIRHGILPVMSLALATLGRFYLLSRNSMISVISKKYMLTARAKGLQKGRIILVHGLKNALLPIITRVFMSLGNVLSGAILVENVFSYPGIGKLMREGVMYRDYVLIQGIFLLVAFLVLTSNFLADVMYRKIDPRVRT